MVLGFIRQKVGLYCRSYRIKRPVVVVDKALRIKKEEVEAELKAAGVEDVQAAVVMPASTPKLVSPLDNNLWHEMKAAIRRRNPQNEKALVECVKEEWAKAFGEFDVFYQQAPDGRPWVMRQRLGPEAFRQHLTNLFFQS